MGGYTNRHCGETTYIEPLVPLPAPLLEHDHLLVVRLLLHVQQHRHILHHRPPHQRPIAAAEEENLVDGQRCTNLRLREPLNHHDVVLEEGKRATIERQKAKRRALVCLATRVL